MPDLKLHFTGPGAGPAAREFATAFSASAGEDLRVEHLQGRSETTRGFDWSMLGAVSSLVNVVLTLPQSILAAKDLLQGFRAKKTAQDALELIKALQAAHPGLTITVSIPGQPPVELGSKSNPIELIDLANGPREED